jgi:hypothetical protein
VVKLSKGDLNTILPCHLALSEHGVAVPLLAHTLDFTVEAEAKRRTCDGTPEGEWKEFVDNELKKSNERNNKTLGGCTKNNVDDDEEKEDSNYDDVQM